MRHTKQVKPFFTDERGEMTHLLDGKVKIISALLITSKKGSIRANHYHKTDSHYCYLLKGKMEYYERPALNEKGTVKKVIIKAGDLFYTPPMALHAMKFLEDSAFLALSTEPREQEKYEGDLVRQKLI